jgi:hypothetical protein
MKIDKDAGACGKPDCPYCLLHCPHCGAETITIDDDGIRCRACGASEDPPPAIDFIRARQRQVLALTGQPLAYWKARGQSLAVPLCYRWRSTLAYLNPVACALLSHVDDLQLQGWTEAAALAQAEQDRAEMSELAAANPKAMRLDLVFLDDWF